VTQFVLAKVHALPLIDARRRGQSSATTSLDLNRTQVELAVGADGVVLPDGTLVAWSAIEAVAKKDDNCFALESGTPVAIHRFSARYNRNYTLRATTAAPTMLISGIPMHRIKAVTPDIDTARKLEACGRLRGRVLDTATGLGYTAIGAAKLGAFVTTIELDPAVIEIARANPWSRDLFDNPNIQHMIGSSFDIVRDLKDDTFDTVLHDPPTFSLAGELYSLEFYTQVHRVLRRGGIFFHYIGDLESRSGQSVGKGAARRMLEAGFTKVAKHKEAFALVTVK
jgi:hypothetical protein